MLDIQIHIPNALKIWLEMHRLPFLWS